MKAFLTEWLIRYGTGEVEVEPTSEYILDATNNASVRQIAANDGYIKDHTPTNKRLCTYTLTPKGLEYLKNV